MIYKSKEDANSVLDEITGKRVSSIDTPKVILCVINRKKNHYIACIRKLFG